MIASVVDSDIPPHPFFQETPPTVPDVVVLVTVTMALSTPLTPVLLTDTTASMPPSFKAASPCGVKRLIVSRCAPARRAICLARVHHDVDALGHLVPYSVSQYAT